MMRRFFARLMNLFRPGAAERELCREIASHLALLEEEYERRGLATPDARLAARRAYGGVEVAKELHREARSFIWLEQCCNDVGYGARSLRRTPGFTALAAITLALGIGASTAIFSVVNAVLLRPLPYQDPSRLVTLLHYGNAPVAVANYLDWREQSRSFEAMGAADYWTPNLTGSNPPERLLGLRVTQTLMPMLGIAPMLGRLFRPGEDQPGSEHEVILSHRLWQRSFNGDADVLGKPITLNGEAYTVVGVMPPTFQFAPFWATRAELWVPDVFGDRVHNRDGNSLRVFARLNPGTTLAQARAEIAALTARLERQYPGTNRGVRVTPLRDNVVGNVETPLLILLGSVGFVLLIACANVAHMLLARTSDRKKEIAVRTALGASRNRIVGQLLIEDILLAALGSLGGLALAERGTRALSTLATEFIPRMQAVSIDGTVLLFLLGITTLTVMMFGLIPATRATVGDLTGALKEGGRGGSGGVRSIRLRGLLVASEFALAFILLIGAGLMIRSFIALESVDPGFNPHHVLSMVVSVAGSREGEPGRRSIFYRQLLEKLRSMPGVASAGGINHLPLAGDLWGWSFIIEGRPKPNPGEEPEAVYRVVMPGYFETMRLPIVRGRALNAGDDERAPGVVLINQRAARKYWPGEDPIGKCIGYDEDKRNSPVWLTIVGVVKDAAEHDWAAEVQPEAYLPALQLHEFLGGTTAHWSYITLVARTVGDPGQFAQDMKKAVWSFDPNLPISEVLTMDRAVADATAQPRFEMLLLGIFAVVALLLAAVGIYGVMNYSVIRRTHEIGIRVSLGARRGEVLRLVMAQGMAQVLIGSAVGLAGALLLCGFMTGILYGVRPKDPITFGAVVIVLGLAALLAILVPARRATRVEPIIALRHE